MNKQLLSLALAGAFALPLAVQAQTTLYGQFNLSYDNMNLGTDTATTAAHYNGVQSNNSRLGVKGAIPFGSDLNAIYQVESGFGAANGGSTSGYGPLATRNTFAGLNNKQFGTIWAGRNDTPYKRATGGFDFFNETIGDMNNVISHPTGGVYGAGFHQRLNRSIGYDGAWNGLYADLQVGTPDPASTGGEPKGTPRFSTVSGLVGYRFAGFDVNYSVEQNKNVATAVGFTSAKAQQFGVGYTLPVGIKGAKLGAVYEKIDSDVASTLTDSFSKKNWWVGASVPFPGNNHVAASYGQAGSSARDGASANGAKQVAIGASHDLNKYASIYAVYARLKNDAGGTYNMGVDHGDAGGAFTAVGGPGQTLSGVSVGLLTKF